MSKPKADVPWKAGDCATIDRDRVVTIDRVTSSGRAIVGDRTFNPNGLERGTGAYRPARLELLTEELEFFIATRRQAKAIISGLQWALRNADRWLSSVYNPYRPFSVETSDVEKAERLTAAIKQVLEDRQDG